MLTADPLERVNTGWFDREPARVLYQLAAPYLTHNGIQQVFKVDVV